MVLELTNLEFQDAKAMSYNQYFQEIFQIGNEVIEKKGYIRFIYARATDSKGNQVEIGPEKIIQTKEDWANYVKRYLE